MQLTELAPLVGSFVALVGACLAYRASRKPKLDEAQVNKLKTEIDAAQETTRQEKARADVRRDRHIVRLEQWGFEKVMPWGRRAATVVDEQNVLLVELASRANIEYTPHKLAPFPEMPQIDDDVRS